MQAKITVYQDDMTVMNFYMYTVTKHIKKTFVESKEKSKDLKHVRK
jgi:hypothetical protein